jgi:histidine ammonia-lyase
MTITLASRSDFTLENCKKVAWEGESVLIAKSAMEKMARARAHLMRLAERPDIAIYGVNTGYGHQVKHRLDVVARQKHAKQPTQYRAASWGDPVPERVARAIVFARLANFIEGHAAVTPALAQAVAAMLDGSPLPPVPARGQGGAGEIMSLSHLFYGLSETFSMGPKDMLSLLNGSPAAAALVADSSLAAAGRLQVAAEVFALAAEAFNTPHGHFAVELENYWNNPHDARALSLLRGLMGSLQISARRPYQTPVSIRILPRVLGEAFRSASIAEEIARQSLVAVTDNPIVIPFEDQLGLDPVISTGGYHNIQAVAAMDGLTVAYTNLAVLAGRIASKLQDAPVSLLPPFLGLEDGRSYLGILAMATVGYEEEMRMLAQPTLLPGSENGGYAQDDVASPVFLAWSKLDRVGLLLDQTLASLAPIAIRALQVTRRVEPDALKGLAAQIVQHFPDNGSNSTFGADIANVTEAFRAKIYGDR